MVELTNLELLEIDGGSCYDNPRDCESTSPKETCIYAGNGNYFCTLT